METAFKKIITYLFLIISIAMVFFLNFFTSNIWTSAQEPELSPREIEKSTNNNTINLVKYILDNDLSLSWDNNYSVGLIRKDNVIISFQPGLAFVLVNFKSQRFVTPVIKSNGILLASSDFISFIDKVLIKKQYPLPPVRTVKVPERAPLNKSNSSNSGVEGVSVASNTSDAQKDKIIILENSLLNPKNSTSKIVTPQLDNAISSKFSRIVTLVIDPGHGGRTPGAVGRFKYNNKSYTLMEKDVVLEVSFQIRDKVRRLYPNLNIVMTRDKDTYVSLEQRTILANKYLDKLKEGEGMLFVSVHANAALTKKASGYEVWYLPAEYQRENLVTKNFNQSQIYTIINNLRDEEITLESSQLAHLVIRGLDEQIGDLSRKRGVKEEKFYVVKNTKMPAILIELGFITNPAEGYNLTRDLYKQKLSNGIVKGISSYLSLF